MVADAREETAIAPEVVFERGMDDVANVVVVRLNGDERGLVECVDGLDPPRPRGQKWVINISTQLGCPVGCPYCDAGGHFQRNLSAAEMLAQVQLILDRHPGAAAECAKLKVHFARMGEPALNDSTLEVLAALPALVGAPALWGCVATVAPRGREKWFERLIEHKERFYRGRFQLQFSLNSTSSRDRARLVPYPHWPLETIAAYGARFHGSGERKVGLNFALARDVAFDPQVVIRLFDPAHFAVKLTPLNPTTRGAAAGFVTMLRSERAARLEEATLALRESGFDVILSVGDERQNEVGSNCGQAVRFFEATRAPSVETNVLREIDHGNQDRTQPPLG